jgi:hypothetical protein
MTLCSPPLHSTTENRIRWRSAALRSMRATFARCIPWSPQITREDIALVGRMAMALSGDRCGDRTDCWAQGGAGSDDRHQLARNDHHNSQPSDGSKIASGTDASRG